MKRKSQWDDGRAFLNPWTWITLHKETVQITQTDQYDHETEHNIHFTSRNQINHMIELLTAAMQEYED